MDTARSETRFPQAQEIIEFWRQAGPAKWFAKDTEFDKEFLERFGELHFAAARRELEAWCQQPESALALVILLDQLPRNAFRGTGHMFATDPLAKLYAQRLLDAGFIMKLDPPLRVFAFLPFTHSENLADQELSLRMYREHAADSLSWGIEHLDIVKRFGRFPHRNASLARETTPEEQAYLDGGGFAG
ncbi:DUF924 family protein [Pusillimonas noertemannii]|uniref:DUF924 family protein n=1 Tax=Pusillimonas noertemannii TaxID=305977 RepID=UPI0002D81F5F|nr:DUF924 family protein [Pusillimonas noertemannii]